MASFYLDFKNFITHYVIPYLTNDIILFNHLKIIIWTFKEWCIHKKMNYFSLQPSIYSKELGVGYMLWPHH
jgi:hypothetical protein